MSGTGNSKPAKESDDEDRPARSKRARTARSSRNECTHNEGAPRVNPEEPAGLGFAQLGLPKIGRKKCNESRELEKSEAMVLQAQQLRVSLQDPLVTRFPFTRAVSMKEKVQSRLTEELTGLYMESIRAHGPGSRAAKVWDDLKTEFRNMELSADFLEALQDTEARHLIFF